MSLRDMLERSGRADRIDDYRPSWVAKDLVDHYWQAKSLLTDIDAPLTPSILREYSQEMGGLLKREERAIILRMDAALRQALSRKRSEIDKHMAEKAKKK